MGDLDEIGSTPTPAGTTPAGTPTPPQVAKPPQFDDPLPRIRTYADDISDEMRKKGSTLTSIVGAERERAARELALDNEVPEMPKSYTRRNVLLLSVALLLLVLGLGAIGTAYYFMSQEEVVTPATPSIIFPNKILAASVTGTRSLADVLGVQRTQAQLSLGEVARLDVSLEGVTTTPQAILQQLDAPAALIREARGIMLGVHSFDRTQPFIIVQVTQYDRAFGAMLEWEEDMGRSLGNFFKPLNGTAVPTTLFTDKVFQNIDIRESQAAWPILYAFPRRDILIITTNQQTLQEVITRLNAQSTP